MGKLLSSLSRAGWKRGRQGSRAWMAVGVGSWVVRKGVGAIRKTEEPVETVRLRAGETIEIRSLEPLTKKERKASKAAARRSN